MPQRSGMPCLSNNVEPGSGYSPNIMEATCSGNWIVKASFGWENILAIPVP